MERHWLSPAEEVAPGAWAGLSVVAAASFVAISEAALSWILSGYTIVIAAGMIGAGRWADRLGRRRVLLGGMGGFTVVSAICTVAPEASVLIAARVLQGFGAAALTPASLALIRSSPESPGRLGCIGCSRGFSS
jgi:MFS family permease